MTPPGHSLAPPERDAAAWVVRTEDPSFDDWDAFEAWLAADPSNAARYDAVMSAVDDAATIVADLPVTASVAPPAPAPASEPAATAPTGLDVARRTPIRRPLRWIGGAMAAALVGTVGLSLWNDRAQPYAIETATGEQRTLRLADGSVIVVAGGSRVHLDRAAPRMAAVDRGAALFRIRHDAHAPFEVQAAGLRMVDLGTVFDVTYDAGVTRVAVGEGEVMVDPAGAALRLAPGQAARLEAGRLTRQDIVAGDVGRWREGSLSFDDATLAEVAASLSRSLPHRVTAAPGVAGLRFQGTIETALIADDPRLLGRLLGVTVTRAGRDWRLAASR